MAIKYVPYFPETIEGQAILDNFTRTRRMLKYRDNDKVIERIRRGMPLYELEKIETVGDNADGNLIIRGECVSACAYLKENNIEVDLVYIDPPFASGADYAKTVYIRRNPKIAEAIKIAEEELDIDELRTFEEKMYGDVWDKEKYLNWVYENLMAIKSVMSEMASIYVHLDYHIGHYVKILLDEAFGEDNFRNEIIWKRKQGNLGQTNQYGIVTDSIFFYSKSSDYLFNPPLSKEGKEEYLKRFKHIDENGRKYRLSPIISPSYSPSLIYEYKGYQPPANGWSLSRNTMEQYEREGRLNFPENKKQRIERKQYLDEWQGSPIQNLWTDIYVINPVALERLEYATQKPETLLERIISASSDNGMLVADFFGGSGVTSAVANKLGRQFIHADIGINSIQTARDRLKADKAQFDVLEIKDGVSLFRNPVQTMDKLKSLVQGLKNEDSLDKFWEGAIQTTKDGLVPVYIPNLMDSTTKLLDTVLMNRIIHEALPDLPGGIKKVIIYYIDIEDRSEVESFIRESNDYDIDIELMDLKELLDETVLGDIIEYKIQKIKEGLFDVHEVSITRILSDRLISKIDEYNQRGYANSLDCKTNFENIDDESPDGVKKSKTFTPITISECGLELIELVSLDCSNNDGPWHCDAEIKIDKVGYVIKNGKGTKEFWNGKITVETEPKRLKIRNISGDETIINIG